jgi:hypothetical protein
MHGGNRQHFTLTPFDCVSHSYRTVWNTSLAWNFRKRNHRPCSVRHTLERNLELMFGALCIADRKHKCKRRNEQRCNLEGSCLLCEERLENIVFGKKNYWKESTSWGSGSKVDKVTENTNFVICFSSGVGEVVGFMWAVRYCIVPAYLTACLLCGRNSTFKYFDLHFRTSNDAIM